MTRVLRFCWGALLALLVLTSHVWAQRPQRITIIPFPTVCPPFPTACPVLPTTCPPIPTHCPAIRTRCPATQTLCKAVLTKCPPVRTKCPPATTKCPAALTKCPPVTTRCPPATTKCPVSLTKCPTQLTKCPPTLTRCRSVVTQCPTFQTRCPPSRTKCPPAATKCPIVTTRCPTGLTFCPVQLTKCPSVTTRCPPSTTKCPPTTTKCPVALTKCPTALTRCPPQSTKCPPADTKCPVSLTKCPVQLTRCPPTLTRCKQVVTQCPTFETRCPPSRTKCPQTQTRCPETRTKCPVKLTQCPTVPTRCPPTPLTPVNQLVGWVTGTPTGQVHIQETHPLCKPVKRCPTVLSPASNPPAGGTGYDPRWQAAWSSDGLTLELRELRGCEPLCRATATRGLGTSSRVSGLAVNDSKSRLFQLETIPGRYAITVYSIAKPTSSACVRLASKCVTGKTLTAKGLAAGLAYNEAEDLLYIATSEPRSTGGFDHYILVARASNPCVPICKYQIPQANCLSPSRLVTGLAYDTCKRLLYATDSIRILELAVSNSATCAFRPARCCTASGPYRGLALIPGWSLLHRGKNCLGRPCPTCPNMVLVTQGGDPSLGNPAFRLSLQNAPGGSPPKFAIVFLRAGGCAPAFPFGCGSVYIFPGYVGPFVVPILGAGCSGQADFPLPIPASTVFCGVKLCAQDLILCPGLPLPGLGLSNALEFVITTS